MKSPPPPAPRRIRAASAPGHRLRLFLHATTAFLALALFPLAARAQPAELRTSQGVRMLGDSLQNTPAGATLTTRAGSGVAERLVPWDQLARVAFPDLDRSPAAQPGIHPSAGVLIPWIRWLGPADLAFLAGEAARAAASLSAADALALIDPLAAHWPPGLPGKAALLELAGDLHDRLGWQDRLDTAVREWITLQSSADEHASAWGWWRLADARWRANAVTEAVWTASHPIAFSPHPDTRGLAECYALAIAGERRIGARARADALLAEARSLGIRIPVAPHLAHWLPDDRAPNEPATQATPPEPPPPAETTAPRSARKLLIP